MKSISPLDLLLKSITKNIQNKAATLLLSAIFFGSTIFAQNSANIIIQPALTSTTVGQTFSVTVKVDFTTLPATSSVDAVEVHLTFDKTKLQVTNITKLASALLPNEAVPLQTIGNSSTPGTINYNGQINYAAFTLSSFPNADFDFLTITFSAVGGGGTTTPLTFLTAAPPNKTDAQRAGSSILGSAISGSVNIQNCTQPTGTLAASAAASICNGQPVGLRLSAATGVSPYSVIVNGSTYNNVTVGTTFTTVAFPSYTLWASPTPAQQNSYDGQPIEVGTKFRSNTTGFVKGMRLYIGSTSTGTAYTCKLWNPANTTTPMATATITPGSSGWQQVTFTNPVLIAANTTYVASYYSASGRYCNTDNYFSADLISGPLTALMDGGIGGANGVYRMGSGGGYPTSTFGSANYWIDVNFTQNTNSFNLTSITDATGCNSAGALQTLNVTSIDCATLPVTLLNLSASPSGNRVTLKWSTSSEFNNRGFDVMRSTDGVTWTSIGFVMGAGNSSSTKNYTYLDYNLESRRYYYKLKQVDIDERYKYSVIVSAVIGSKGEYTLGQNYPNPFSNETTIQYTLAQSGQVNLSLFDISGRMVKVLVNGSKESGTHAISFTTGMLNKGVYYYKIQVGDFTDVKKLTIQ